MRTVGKFLKETRVKKKHSRVALEKVTKIKREFIEAIEEENWEELPEFPVVAGFVKSIAGVLKIEQKQAVALLRRDYPPKKLAINPKPDVSDRFTWSPRLTFLAAVVIVSLGIFSYLGFQYINFVSPPHLLVEYPKDGQIVTEEILQVLGATDPEATVKVNNQPVLVSGDGRFSTEIEIIEGTGEVEVKATSRSGKETVVKRKIITELE